MRILVQYSCLFSDVSSQRAFTPHSTHLPLFSSYFFLYLSQIWVCDVRSSGSRRQSDTSRGAHTHTHAIPAFRPSRFALLSFEDNSGFSFGCHLQFHRGAIPTAPNSISRSLFSLARLASGEERRIRSGASGRGGDKSLEPRLPSRLHVLRIFDSD